MAATRSTIAADWPEDPPACYWLEFWWLVPIALSNCVLVCLVGAEGSLLFAPFYAVIFPWLSGVELALVQAIRWPLVDHAAAQAFTPWVLYGMTTAMMVAPALASGVLVASARPARPRPQREDVAGFGCGYASAAARRRPITSAPPGTPGTRSASRAV